MKIYTKTGDNGQTGLFGGQRVSKSSLRIASYGHIDELNSLLSVCRALNESDSKNKNDFLEKILHELQQDLFVVGADMATPLDTSNASIKIERISDKYVTKLEKWIDEIDLKLSALKNFILPGGTILASHLHLARCVCRRAERAIVALQSKEPINTIVVIYVNRLSDLLFMMGRHTNTIAGKSEEIWLKNKYYEF